MSFFPSVCVERWYNKFYRDRRPTSDERDEDHPKSVVLSENIDAVKNW